MEYSRLTWNYYYLDACILHSTSQDIPSFNPREYFTSNQSVCFIMNAKGTF